MKEVATLHARLINHGQSEIWLEVDGKEVTQRRTLATNEVNVTRLQCTPEAFAAFYAAWQRCDAGRPNLDEIATQLRLSA